MKRVISKIDDCFIIPLPDGRKVYGQYVHWDGQTPAGLGCLVQIFDLFTQEEVPIEWLVSARPLFPPVFAGLKGALKNRRWRIIGQLPVKGFVFPRFRYSHNTTPGTYHNWTIWDGVKNTPIGDLPPELRSLEFECVWGYEPLEKRIATGQNSFDLVQ